MAGEESKAVVQCLYDELFNRGHAAVADQLVCAEFVDHGAAPGAPRGPAGMRLAVARLRAAVPDGRYVLEELIGEDDRVAARVTVVGSRRGSEAEPTAPAGRVTQAQMHDLRLIGGRVSDLWAVQDEVAPPLRGSEGGHAVRRQGMRD